MICLIPARGGSKRVPRKNVRLFHGRPMISWAIESSIESGLFERVVVSTDDDEIAAVSLQAGAEVPFKRPAELADDLTVTRDVVVHAIGALGVDECPKQHLCIRYPTTPLLRPDDLRGGSELFEESGADFVFSAARFAYPIQRALTLVPGGQGVRMLQPQHRQTRSQDLEETFHDAGQFYMGSVGPYLAGSPTFGEKSRPYFIPYWRVVDIDTEEDWQHAESLYRVFRD